MAIVAAACSPDNAPTNIAPKVTATGVTDVTRAEATLCGRVELQGTTAMPELHFAINRNGQDETIITQQPTVIGDSVSQRVDGLTPGREYHFYLQATNGRTTMKSNSLTFSTEASKVPTVSEATDITHNEATLHGKLDVKDTSEAEVECLLGTDNNLEPVSDSIIFTPDSITVRLTGLTANTTYYFCLTANDGYSETHSDTLSFTTLPNTKPTVGQPVLLSYGPTSMVVQYVVPDNGGEPLTATGIYVTETATGNRRRVEVTDNINNDTISPVRIGDLELLTSYEISAYAANSIGEATSEPLTLTTGNAFVLDAPGQLASLIGSDVYKFTELAFVGPMNGDDLRCLRRMMGREPTGAAGQGRLAVVDMTDAHIVEGGGTYGSSRYTSDNVVGYGLFADCTALTTVILPADATTIEENALRGCTSLTTLTIPATATKVSPSTGCSALKSVNVSAGSTAFSSRDGVLMDAAQTQIVWFPMAKTGDYVLPESVTGIGDYAFSECGITRFTMNDGVKNMGQAAFYGSRVEEVTLSDGLRTVPTSTFQNCTALHTVRLGASTELISDYAFHGCPLRHLYVDAPYPPVCNANAFTTSYSDLFNSCVLHVPAGRSGFYKADSDWGKFKNIVEE